MEELVRVGKEISYSEESKDFLNRISPQQALIYQNLVNDGFFIKHKLSPYTFTKFDENLKTPFNDLDLYVAPKIPYENLEDISLVNRAAHTTWIHDIRGRYSLNFFERSWDGDGIAFPKSFFRTFAGDISIDIILNGCQPKKFIEKIKTQTVINYFPSIKIMEAVFAGELEYGKNDSYRFLQIEDLKKIDPSFDYEEKVGTLELILQTVGGMLVPFFQALNRYQLRRNIKSLSKK